MGRWRFGAFGEDLSNRTDIYLGHIQVIYLESSEHWTRTTVLTSFETCVFEKRVNFLNSNPKVPVMHECAGHVISFMRICTSHGSKPETSTFNSPFRSLTDAHYTNPSEIPHKAARSTIYES